jgi:hypothetical protein
VIRESIAAVTLLLAACAAGAFQANAQGKDAQGYKWERGNVEVQPANWRYHLVKDGNVFLHCENHAKALACSRIERGGAACDIYLPDDHEPWMKAHEEKHCAGWRHPNSLRIGLRR